MNRRDTVIALFALGAVPLTVEAQQRGKIPRVGFRRRSAALERGSLGHL